MATVCLQKGYGSDVLSDLVVFLLSSQDRSAADKLVVLLHTQMFPFIIYPDQS